MKHALLSFVLTLPLLLGSYYPPHLAEARLKADKEEQAQRRKEIYRQCKADYQRSMLNLLMDSISRSGRYFGTLLVAENGEVVFRKSFGNSIFEPEKAFTPEIPMQLASVSKPFTAVAMLKLIEHKLVNYDDDIRKYLPQLRYQGITVRHLLNHTSGLPDYLNRPQAFERYISRRQELTNQKLYQVLAQNKPALEFSPGKRHKYSNTGYALLPLIIEQVTGQTFQQFMQEQIFDPLQMRHTFFYSKDKNLKMMRDNEHRDGVLGDKGLFSTVDDMLKWDQALYTDKLVKRKTLDEAFEQGETLSAEKFDYGFGWRLSTSSFGERIIYHRGLWQGANPMLIRIVDCNRTIISLHHATRFDSWYLVNTVNEILNRSEVKCFGY
jgi:CubicO group peptidase (beta-lactamase class C family)